MVGKSNMIRYVGLAVGIIVGSISSIDNICDGLIVDDGAFAGTSTGACGAFVSSSLSLSME